MQLSFNGPIAYEAALFFNKFQSLFEYKETFLGDESIEKIEDTKGNINITYHDKSLRYIRSNKEKNLIREFDGEFNNNAPYEIEESIPVISWNIFEDIKKINQHDCNKATCSFRGRNYTVWFTTDIQTGFGPLKLNGLPGLILEISDDTKEVVLFAKEVRKEEKVIENKPFGIKIIPRPEYKKKIVKGLKELEETGKILSSQMDRGFKVSFKISQPKSIEMDYDFGVPQK